MDPQPGPAAFDRADAAVLAPRLAGCLRAQEWAGRLLAGRPYRTLTSLERAATEAALDLSDDGLAEALTEHPLTAPRPSADGTGADRLHAATVAYQARFGHAPVVRSTGRTDAEVLRAVQDRLGNDPATEGIVVRRQLGEIAVLRLQDLLADLVGAADADRPAG